VTQTLNMFDLCASFGSDMSVVDNTGHVTVMFCGDLTKLAIVFADINRFY